MQTKDEINKCRRKNYLTINGRASRLYSSAKQRAKHHNLKFDLNVDWVIKKIEEGRCEKTGLEFTLEPPRKGYFHNPYAPSLDRRDHTKGYTKDNVDVVIWAYNQAKGQWNKKHFERIMRSIVRYGNFHGAYTL